jgi:hypothetical protein
MCAQLDLKVMCKSFKEKEDHLIFMNFGMKKFTVKNTLKNTLNATFNQF